MNHAADGLFNAHWIGQVALLKLKRCSNSSGSVFSDRHADDVLGHGEAAAILIKGAFDIGANSLSK